MTNEEKPSCLESVIYGATIGCVVGAVAGAVGGVWVGNSANEYFEVLKQAPKTIKYAADVIIASGCGIFGASLGATIGAIPGLRDYLKSFKQEKKE